MFTALVTAAMAAFIGLSGPKDTVGGDEASPLIRVANAVRALPGRNCPAPRTVRSPASNRPTQIYFTNDLNGPVDLYWINFKGRWQKYARIRRGGKYTQQTYVGHAWVAYNVRTRDCVGNSLYFAKPDRGQGVHWHY